MRMNIQPAHTVQNIINRLSWRYMTSGLELNLLLSLAFHFMFWSSDVYILNFMKPGLDHLGTSIDNVAFWLCQLLLSWLCSHMTVQDQVLHSQLESHLIFPFIDNCRVLDAPGKSPRISHSINWMAIRAIIRKKEQRHLPLPILVTRSEC